MDKRSKISKLLTFLQIIFLLLLVPRSFTGAFPNLSIYLGPTTLNLSVAVVFLVDMVGLTYLGILWYRGEMIFDRIGGIFTAWVLSLAPWVFIASAQFGIPGLTGVREWIRLLSLVLLYLVVLTIARRTNFERIINFCLLALPIPLAATYYQIIFGTGEVTSVGVRALGTMVHPNNLAAFLVVMIALTIWKMEKNFISKGSLLKKLLWGGVLVLELPALIAPISSNYLLMFGLFLLTLAIVVQKARFRVMTILAVLLLFILFAFLSSQYLNLTPEITRNLRDLGFQISKQASSGGSLARRFQIWPELIGVWQAHPLRGYGLNTTYFINPVEGMAAHNDYLRYLVEGGIFGLLFFLLFIVAIGRELFQLRQYANDSKRRLLTGIGVSIFIAWAIGSIGDNLIAFTSFQAYFWALLATVSAATPTTKSRLWSGRRALKLLYRMGSYMANTRFASLFKEREKKRVLRCSRCRVPALTSGDIFCWQCLKNYLPLKAVFSLGALILFFIGIIGFYLWNQGAGLETFFVGWLLFYTLVVIFLRNYTSRYFYGILMTALIGLVSSNLLFKIPVSHFQRLVWFSSWGILGLAIYGLLASWWAVVSSKEHLLGSTIPSSLLAVGKFYLRHYLLPIGALLGAAYTLNWVLHMASSFIYGDPISFGYLLAGLMGIYVELWLIMWGLTDQGWKATSLSLALSYLSILGWAQISVLFTTGILWATAKLLPVFSPVERFAPLLLERPVGLYTWISLGITFLVILNLLPFRKRLTNKLITYIRNKVRSKAASLAFIQSQNIAGNIIEQLKLVVGAHPDGLTLPEIGKLLDRDWRSLTIHIKKLVDEGSILKSGKKYFPTDNHSSSHRS